LPYELRRRISHDSKEVIYGLKNTGNTTERKGGSAKANHFSVLCITKFMNTLNGIGYVLALIKLLVQRIKR
tara:strand:- start:1808 stop:2020 length:213 start_codon:yes stop_codon:yes gene_type:complete